MTRTVSVMGTAGFPAVAADARSLPAGAGAPSPRPAAPRSTMGTRGDDAAAAGASSDTAGTPSATGVATGAAGSLMDQRSRPPVHRAHADTLVALQRLALGL